MSRKVDENGWLTCTTQNEPIEYAPVKHGRWIRHNTYHGDDTSGFIDPDWRCSECENQANVNVWSMYDLTDFCPHCGCKMDGDENAVD